MKKEEFYEHEIKDISSIGSNLGDRCEKICNQSKVRFCGVVNSMGRLVAGGLKEGIAPLENEDQRQMLYIQSYLEMSMKRDFDDTLGKVDYMITYRENLALIYIPLKENYLLLLSTEKNAEIKQIIQVAISLFDQVSLNHQQEHEIGNSAMSPEFA